ncbi:MAG: carboxypeptidase-like regulatory domain-containing protein [Desulfobulbaceae bacterium]
MNKHYGQQRGIVTTCVPQRRRTSLYGSLLLFVLLALAAGCPAVAEETGMLSGRVVDVGRNPVAGASIFVYNTGNIRRPADYISPPTDSAGAFRLSLPPGRYWAVARARQGEEKYGPLLPGDRHSGAPLETEIRAGETVEEEFVVADLRETSQLEVKRDVTFHRIEGVLLDKEGAPLADVYAFARREQSGRGIPEFVSAWTDAGGGYVLFLPPGTYWLGIAATFPPEPATVPRQKVVVDNPAKNINIVLQ